MPAFKVTSNSRPAKSAKGTILQFPQIDERLGKPLTARESEAVALLPLPNKNIAAAMGCGVRTAKQHLASARAKFGAANRCELAMMTVTRRAA